MPFRILFEVESYMQRNFVRQFAITSVVIALVSISVLSAAFIARARQNFPYVLTSQTVPLVSRARLLGAANAQQQLNLSIGLQLRNQQELQTLLSNMYNPQSPRYHQFLSPQQFVDEFGPTADQQQQVIDYLHQQGLSITHISSNRLLIDASATVAQAETAFQVLINTYQLGSNVFYANANPPTIPGQLSAIIASIGGLDNSVHMHPLYRRANLGIGKPKTALDNKSHSIRAHPRGLGGGYGPTELNSAYDATPLLQADIQGSNQTVAVFELDGYPSSDVTQYFQAYNLGNPSITDVLVDGFNGSAGQWAIEVDLDVEVVAAMAPKAAQIVYEGPNTTQGINETYNQIVTDDKAQITTISWGLCEASTGNTELQTLDNIFSQGAAEGISMFAASGDAGAYDCGDTNLAVDSPAGDPNITGVGGTHLQLNNGVYGSESVWSNPSNIQRGPKGLATGLADWARCAKPVQQWLPRGTGCLSRCRPCDRVFCVLYRCGIRMQSKLANIRGNQCRSTAMGRQYSSHQRVSSTTAQVTFGICQSSAVWPAECHSAFPTFPRHHQRQQSLLSCYCWVRRGQRLGIARYL